MTTDEPTHEPSKRPMVPPHPPPPPPSTPPPARPSMTRRRSQASTEVDDIGTAADSETKARILAQQREVMLRRRQEGMRAEAVRSVEDPSRATTTTIATTGAAAYYHTPGIKQFSTPRTAEGEEDPGALQKALLEDRQAAKDSKRVVPRPQGPPPPSDARRIHSYRARLSSSSSFSNAAIKSPAPLSTHDKDEDEDGAASSDSEDEAHPSPQEEDGSDDDGLGHSSSSAVAAAVALSQTLRPPSFRKPLDFATLLAGRSGVEAFVTHPVPRTAGTVQCYIKRRKAGAGKLYPEYYLYTRQGDHFLMAAKKQANNKTSNYHVTMNEGDFAKESPDYLGKVRANFVGTEFQLFDHGQSSKEVVNGAGALGLSNTGKAREELGVVVYAANVLGSRGPRKMQAFLPRVNAIDDRVAHWKEAEDLARDDALLERVRRGDTAKFHHFINKPPRWNDQVGAYVLNFNGRVTMASVKNFQLIAPEDHEVVVLQFGRVGKHAFTMDVRWPFSPLQAFGLALSSFDSKIACD